MTIRILFFTYLKQYLFRLFLSLLNEIREMQIRNFHVHGDNIIECERFIGLIEPILIKKDFIKNDSIGSFIAPKITFNNPENQLNFQLFPGFSSDLGKDSIANAKRRWDYNILNLIRDSGGILNEAADILLTEITEDEEKPIIAIEYCSALPAGNQAWQRSGRAYSYGKAKIPLIYIYDIGAYELDSDRGKKAVRLPNAAIPFSYLTFSRFNNVPVHQVFIANPGADQTIKTKFKDSFGNSELSELLAKKIFHEDIRATLEAIEKKELAFVLESTSNKTAKRFNSENWQDFYDIFSSDNLSLKKLLTFIEENGIKGWNKKISMDVTTTLRQHLAIASSIGYGITSYDLPFCLIKANDRKIYAEKLEAIYKDKISKSFYSWIASSNNPMVICYIAGFKPRGDDSRPDRGLVPFCRMLMGDEVDVMSVIYGPLKINKFNELCKTPQTLNNNGLWQAIYSGSSAIIVDSMTTENLKNIAYLRNHWIKETSLPSVESFQKVDKKPTTAYPLQYGENDVDSLIHNFFKKYEYKNYAFEVICNPPGGDWSGMSYRDTSSNLEYRWLTLPRVSEIGTKRPDHVIQVYGDDEMFLLSIESKEWAKDIDEDIGLYLNQYTRNLLNYPSNATRSLEDNIWHDGSGIIDLDNITLVSGIAFFNKNDINKNTRANNRANADISFIVSLDNGKEKLVVEALNLLGDKVVKILKEKCQSIDMENLNITFIFYKYANQ